MTRRATAILILVGALALLGASLAWATTRTTNSGHHYGYGPQMMGYGYTTARASPVTSLADARTRAQTYADKLALKTGEVMRFQRNYYVQLVDTSGKPATEVLVDPVTGAVGLEFGPAMMWNTRYGMTSGRYGDQMAWLDKREPGLKVETGGNAFPGYYTLETLRNGQIAGMTSINATTGAVWPHWWHGAFIEASA